MLPVIGISISNIEHNRFVVRNCNLLFGGFFTVDHLEWHHHN